MKIYQLEMRRKSFTRSLTTFRKLDKQQHFFFFVFPFSGKSFDSRNPKNDNTYNYTYQSHIEYIRMNLSEKRICWILNNEHLKRILYVLKSHNHAGEKREEKNAERIEKVEKEKFVGIHVILLFFLNVINSCYYNTLNILSRPKDEISLFY